MPYLVDTSILARLANTSDPFHVIAVKAVVELHRRGETLNICPQNLIEFSNMATRPTAVNGLGLTAVDAEAKAAVFEATFPLLADTPDIYPTWRAIVCTLEVIGKQVHDARLVAVCHEYGMTHLLTFNSSHFLRMARFGPGIIVVDPKTM